MALNCYGCGESLTSPERYTLYTASHSRVLSMWKRLVSDRLKETESTVGVNEFWMKMIAILVEFVVNATSLWKSLISWSPL